jgi:predicted secreted Zn-dependent protease
VKSWGLMKTDYILAHEQGHFDITEIFARKLNEALQNYEFNKKTFRKDINDIYQAIVKQKEEYQKMYDGETDHSRNKKIQYEWLEKIQELLAVTENFAAYP